ncbi:MAG: hypothetical protein RLZZ338_4697 [Cyanobacteriota bacterium]|jgi:hypothetical protein
MSIKELSTTIATPFINLKYRESRDRAVSLWDSLSLWLVDKKPTRSRRIGLIRDPFSRFPVPCATRSAHLINIHRKFIENLQKRNKK